MPGTVSRSGQILSSSLNTLETKKTIPSHFKTSKDYRVISKKSISSWKVTDKIPNFCCLASNNLTNLATFPRCSTKDLKPSLSWVQKNRNYGSSLGTKTLFRNFSDVTRSWSSSIRLFFWWNRWILKVSTKIGSSVVTKTPHLHSLSNRAMKKPPKESYLWHLQSLASSSRNAKGNYLERSPLQILRSSTRPLSRRIAPRNTPIVRLPL